MEKKPINNAHDVANRAWNQINTLLQEKGMNITQLADLVGMSHSGLYGHRHKHTLPKNEILADIADILEVEMESFFCPESQRTDRLIQKINAIQDPSKRNAIRRMINDILELLIRYFV